MSVEIEKSHINIKTVLFLLVTVVSMTFSLTTIYNQFLLQDEIIKELRGDLEYDRLRADKLRKRLEERIHILEQPGSDEHK